MTILTIWSESGGVGKTTTCLNLAAALGRREYDVLVVDMDSQPGSITDYAGFPAAKTTTDGPTITDVFLEDAPIESVVESGEHFDLVPGHESLATLESTVRAKQLTAAEFLLRTALTTVESEYEFILIDPPATLNLLVDNALIASGRLLIPMEMTRKGKRSVMGVLETARALETQLQRAQPEFTLDVVGVVPNRVTAASLHESIADQLREELASTDVPILDVSIPAYNVLESTWAAQLDIFTYAEEVGLRQYQTALLDAYDDLADLVAGMGVDPTVTETEAEVLAR